MVAVCTIVSDDFCEVTISSFNYLYRLLQTKCKQLNDDTCYEYSVPSCHLLTHLHTCFRCSHY